MKIRISGDSVRLRLKRGEVDRIASGQSIEEQTHFAGSMLTYRLEVRTDGQFSASLADNRIVVCLPGEKVVNWARTDEVSIYSELATTDTDTLSILVEKDFTCLTPGHHRDCKDDEDTFPHPARSAIPSS